MKKLFGLLMVVGMVAGGSGIASASPVMLFDRGLPTANLNNAAGANRSNVEWAFFADPSTPADRYLVGDDFTIGGAGNYLVSTLRVWSSSSTDLSLWFGPEGGSIVHLIGAPTVTAVTYANGSGYQGNSGNFGQLFQIDFSLDQVLSGTTTYQFFLDGPMEPAGGAPPYTDINNAFLHSSNAALSGSTQQLADNLMLYGGSLGTGTPDIGTWSPLADGAWDKTSDANVQIFGEQVPEPASLVLLGSGLIGVARTMRKRRKTA